MFHCINPRMGCAFENYDLFNKNHPHEIIFWLFPCTTCPVNNAIWLNHSAHK